MGQFLAHQICFLGMYGICQQAQCFFRHAFEHAITANGKFTVHGTRVLGIAALHIEHTVVEDQTAIRDAQDVGEPGFQRGIYGKKTAIGAFYGAKYAMFDQILHDFPQKMVRDIQAL